MARYVQFKTAGDESVLVEVSDERSDAPDGGETGVGKIALRANVGEVITKADAAFESALDTVRRNASAFIQQIGKMMERPSEVEVEFGLKLTGEMGLFAVAKASGEANYVVKLVWKQESSAKGTPAVHSGGNDTGGGNDEERATK